MCYEQNLTQSQIAQKVGYSRSMISRMISEARENNIVKIRIHYPLQRIRELESYLQDVLGLKDARVLQRGALNHSEMLRRLGALAASLLEEHLHDHLIIGTSWGTAVYETINTVCGQILE